MVTIQELKRWAGTVIKNLPDSEVGVDDGGLTLLAISPSGNFAYYDTGGIRGSEDRRHPW